MPRSNRTATQKRNTNADKYETILRAAIKVFAQKGYFNSKVSDIAGQAKIADGTVYLYFKSKEEILHSIFDRLMKEFILEIEKELEGVTRADEKLRRIARMHLENLGSDRDLAIVFQVQLRGSIKFMREFSSAGFAKYLDLIKRAIEEGKKQKLFRKDLNATVCSKILYGALDEMVTNWILSDKKYDLAPLTDEVLKVFFSGVYAKEN